MVGDNPVDLLRVVQRMQAVACLNMTNRVVQLHRSQRTRQRGIGITKYQQQIRPLLNQNLLDLHQHTPSHCSVRTPPVGWIPKL